MKHGQASPLESVNFTMNPLCTEVFAVACNRFVNGKFDDFDHVMSDERNRLFMKSTISETARQIIHLLAFDNVWQNKFMLSLYHHDKCKENYQPILIGELQTSPTASPMCLVAVLIFQCVFHSCKMMRNVNFDSFEKLTIFFGLCDSVNAA